jgi:hypothetical protein
LDVITDARQRVRIADLYRAAFAEYRESATQAGGCSPTPTAIPRFSGGCRTAWSIWPRTCTGFRSS